MARKKSSLRKRISWLFFLLLVGGAAVVGYKFYEELFCPNVSLNKREQFILIPTGSSFADVKQILISQDALIDTASFTWVAKRMKYQKNIRPGRYLIKTGMSNKQIVALLRSGEQTPVDLSLNNIHTKQQLAESVSSQIEAPQEALLKMLNDSIYTRSLGYTPATVLSFFIPNTYQMYWNTSPAQFINKMRTEYNRYWTPEKRKQAIANGLTTAQVATLASIVQMETAREAEKPLIAGV
jgi:UPF0755 protein